MDKISIQNRPFIPDIICSIYYRYIIKTDVIQRGDGKIFNLHPSLLPRYRGCSSLTWAMINGEKECGYTYHYIDAAFTKVASNVDGYKQSEGKLYKRGCPMNGELSMNSNLDYADRFIRAMNNPPYPPAICEGKEIYTIKEFMKLKSEKLEK